MKLDGRIGVPSANAGPTAWMDQAASGAAALEAASYSGAWTVELTHDPFLPLVVAAEHTETIDLGTAIAVAFARNPMTLANTSWDLQAWSKGRFKLGLGTQIRAHITNRFSMPWSKPAARMNEMVRAMRAIWESWETGEPLAFRGDFYRHTLMTPMFSPGPNPYGPPPIHMAGVGNLMTETAGEVADGWMSHGFTTPSYLREVSLPALQRGAQKSGRDPKSIEVSLPLFLVTGANEEEMAASAKAVRRQIGFYGSTPAYRPVLEHHGWAGAQEELNWMSKQGKWDKMAEVIDDTMLNTFAVVAEPHDLAEKVAASVGGLVDRLTLNTGTDNGLSNPANNEDSPNTANLWAEVCEALRAVPTRSTT
ncbi:MAG: TIGR03617 family F420-dependent LLM class oxidoreductase [bacterium]|nr:TIGR03617 family F420-dependent LLM class oxidoreductase [bacterium]